jgi:hypothetical protein
MEVDKFDPSILAKIDILHDFTKERKFCLVTSVKHMSNHDVTKRIMYT